MSLKAYRTVSLTLAIAFGIVGLIFFFMSTEVLLLFNKISGILRMEEASQGSSDFYLVLGVAYMYLVTLLAFLMFRNPGKPVYPLLLFNGKIASSAVSIFFFLFDRPLLIYLTNGIVDGMIGVLVVAMYRNVKRVSP